MSDAVIVVLPGEPRGWARVQVRVITPRGKKPFPSFYTDKATRAYQEALCWLAKAEMRSRPPIEGPISVKVIVSMSVPSSWSTKKRDAALAGTIRPTGKPDWDNFGKQGDAFKGVLWIDDAQIVDGRVVKVYAEKPEFRIEVRPLDVFPEPDVDAADDTR